MRSKKELVWRIFKPDPIQFRSMEAYNNYRDNCKCGVCHKRLEIGEEFDLRPIQTPEQAGELTVQAVIVHRACLDEGKKE